MPPGRFGGAPPLSDRRRSTGGSYDATVTSRFPSEAKSLPWPAVGSALLTACLVVVPLVLGIGLGDDAAGVSATLGAYLWAIGHLTVHRPIDPRLSAAAAVLLGVAGATGALAGRHLWLLVVLGAAWAVFQALAETTGSALRMPAAMSALGFLLCAIGGGADAAQALLQGVLVLGGASWMALWEFARHRPRPSPVPGSRLPSWAELKAAWPRSRPFALLLSVPTALAAGTAGLLQISHGAWTATTVLRVLRPESSATLARSGRRIVGTSAGALLAAVLLVTAPDASTAVISLVVCLSAMQLIGAARYGFYTFFLTLLALELVSVGHPASWRLALVRTVLTCAGALIAVTSGFIFDRVTGARRSTPARR